MTQESCSVLGTWTVPGERDCRAMYTWLALNYTGIGLIAQLDVAHI